MEALDTLDSILDIPFEGLQSLEATTLAQTGVEMVTKTCDHSHKINKAWDVPDFYADRSTLFSDEKFKAGESVLFWADRGEADGAVSEYKD